MALTSRASPPAKPLHLPFRDHGLSQTPWPFTDPMAFHRPHGERHGVFRRKVHTHVNHTHVNMVRPRMPFQKFHSLLRTQIPKNPPDSATQLAIDDFPAILGDKHNMILAQPANVRPRYNVFQTLFLLPRRDFLEKERILFTPYRQSLSESHGQTGHFVERALLAVSHA